MRQKKVILQISSRDVLGGAEGVALTLAQEFAARELETILAVGCRSSAESKDVTLIRRMSHKSTAGSRLCWEIVRRLRRYPKIRWVQRLFEILALPQSFANICMGYEDYSYPGTWDLLDCLSKLPRIIHCHNLQGYFDLRVLPTWSRQCPLVLHLHDMWLLTGHCAHSMGCERYASKCGSCPDLSIPPAIRRDRTEENLLRKQSILAHSVTYAITPSHWLEKQLRNSLLKPQLVRVIPNGTDLNCFAPGCPRRARAQVGLPQDAFIVTFSARGTSFNPFKDFHTIEQALRLLEQRDTGRPLHLVSLGASHESVRQLGTTIVHDIPFMNLPKQLVPFLQASDLYIHAARAETFGKAIVEALACGVPVVATAVGGIPEIVRCLGQDVDCATGILTEPGNPVEMAAAIEFLLRDAGLRARLGENGRRDVFTRFSLTHQADRVLEFYTEVEEHWSSLGEHSL